MNIAIRSEFSVSELSNFLRDRVDPFVLEWDQNGHFPFQVYQSLQDMGLLQAPVPKKYGGTELPMIDLLTVASELAFHSTGVFSIYTANLLGQTAISRFASETLAESVFADHFAKKNLFAFCATEKETGTDIASMCTVAKADGQGFRIHGKKHYISNINYASHLVVLARTEVDGQNRGLSAFYVPANDAGVEVGEPLKKLGQRESNTGRVTFNNVFVPASSLLGKVGDGVRILFSCVSRTKTLLAGAAVGICRRAEQEALDYLVRTQRYGEPLLAKREIQKVLSAQHAQMDAAWLLACRSGAVYDREGIASYESALAKYFAADAAVSFVNEALELVGATGYMADHFLSKLHRDVKVFEIFEGASLVQQTMMERELYGHLLKPDRKKGG